MDNNFNWNQTISLAEDTVQKIRIATLNLFLKRTNTKLYIGQSFEEESNETTCQWTEFSNIGTNEILIQPILPSASVVIRATKPIYVLKNMSVNLYVQIPIILRIAVSQHPELSLIDIPLQPYSKIWVGSYTSGELCYDIASPLEDDNTSSEHKFGYIKCPISISNQLEDKHLNLNYVLIKTELLSIYELDQKLWTDKLSIIFDDVLQQVVRYETAENPHLKSNNFSVLTRSETNLIAELTSKVFGNIYWSIKSITKN